MKINDLNNFYLGFEHFFPEGAPPKDESYLKWKNRKEFTDEVKEKTGIDIANGNLKAIKDSQMALANLTKEGEKVEATVPDKFQREQQEIERAAREAAQKEAKEKGTAQTEEFLKQLKERVKNKAVYAKVEAIKPERLTAEEQKAYDDYKNAIKADPNKIRASEDLAQEIKARVAPTLTEQGATEEEIKSLSEQTARTLVEKMAEESTPTYVPVGTQAAILSNVANDTKIVAKVVGDKAAENVVKTTANNVAVFKIYPDQIARNITTIAFGERFSETIFGVSPNKIKVELSDAPVPSFTQAVNFGELNQAHVELQGSQNQALEMVKEQGTSQAKSFLLKQTGTFLEGKIASLPTTSVAGKILRTPEAQSLFFSTFGVGTAVKWEATNWVGGLALKFAPESAPILSAFGKFTGINLVKPAITQAVSQATTQVAAKVATGLLPRIFAAVGALGSWATFGLSMVAGWVLGKIAEKIPWDKVKKALPYIVGAILFPFFGPKAAVAGGLGTAVLGGATLAGVGAGIGAFFWGLGRATAITIGTPILVTLLVFPVVVALILFIINSGAYVVPPSSLSSLKGYDNPYMSVTKTANPDKMNNPSTKTTVIYTVEITALKSPLTNLQIVSTSCKVSKKDKTKVPCPIENVPDIPSGTTVSPSSPYSFTFTADFGPVLTDSIVFDTIEISADTPEKSEITTSGSETVCVGDCPTSCVKVSDSAMAWPNNLRSNVESYTNGLDSEFPDFAAQVCADGEVNLCYNPPRINPGYYAWHVHDQYGDSCDVYFNEKGVNNDGDAKFLVTHELTHHIQAIDPNTVRDYENSGAYSEVQNQGFCSYSDTKGSRTESMAEAAGLYANIPSWGTCASPYKSKYPRNYVWAEGFMK